MSLHEHRPEGSVDALGMRRTWVPFGGHRLAANERPGAGPAFLLLHGFPDDAHLWDAVVPELGDRRVVTFDFLGWGESDKPQDHAYTFPGQLQEIAAVVDHLDLGPVEIVGHDSSVPAALDWALDHAELTASSTVMNGFYLTGGSMRPPALISVLVFSTFPDDVELGPLPAGALGGLGALGERLADDEEFFLSVWRWQQRRFFAREQDADHYIPLFERQFRGAESSRVPLRSLAAGTFPTIVGHAARLDDLRQLPMPVNVVWGGLDQDLAVGQAWRIHEVVPHSRLEIIEDARHNVPIDEPARVASILLSTLATG